VREAHNGLEAAVRGRPQLDVAAIRFDQPPDDREAQTRAGTTSRAPEAVERLLALLVYFKRRGWF